MRLALPTFIVLLALPLAACKSRPNLERTYERMIADYSRDEGAGGLVQKIDARQRERCDEVAAWCAEGVVETAEDHLFAAAILTRSDKFDHLELARDLALRAAELGDERAFAVQAEAVDKICLKEKKPQRYGTQYVWEPVLGKWRHYAVDPMTTDEVRRAMGIPPLAELRARVDALNAGAVTRKLKGE